MTISNMIIVSDEARLGYKLYAAVLTVNILTPEEALKRMQQC